MFRKFVVSVICVLFAYFGTTQVADTGQSTGRWAIVTAYCSCEECCGEHAVGLFASGRRVYWGGVAADWRVFPQGTKVEIEGFQGPFRVEDKGRLIKGSKLDIWMPTHAQAEDFGRQRLWVTVNRL